jgi:lysophospholipase L1-like esterase
MLDWYKNEIIKRKGNKSKLLIGLGDSFTQGQGACSTELWESYNWDLEKSTEKDNFNLLKSSYENSWVNKICENHLTDFTPINFGMTGRGNRGAVKELYLHPDLQIEKSKEIIVVFMLTGMERFDFVHRNFNEHVHYRTMWPNDDDKLSLQYLEDIWSDEFGIIESLLAIAEVKMWCKSNNAKLFLISAFSTKYNFDYFYTTLNEKNTYLKKNQSYLNLLLNTNIDWDNFIRPKGYTCVTDFLCHLEGREDLINSLSPHDYYRYAYKLDKFSPNEYITNCAHPSYKGHEKIAEMIYEEIIKNKQNKQNKLI